MRIRILDLDGSLLAQKELLARVQPAVHALEEWGPRIRLGCCQRRFRQFERALATVLGKDADSEPALTFYGSGDFHHVSLALVRRVKTPFNLVVIDNHPDWMRGVPLLHCGTWLYHAAQLAQVRRVFHLGGDVDFDNYYRWLAPWELLESGKIVVFPAVRRFERGRWSGISNEPLRADGRSAVLPERVEELLRPFRAELEEVPLYLSLDKDVLVAGAAAVNWDSGRLTLAEVRTLLSTLGQAAGERWRGLDILGDWSPVRVHGLFRRFLHLTEHPALEVDPVQAAHGNERANMDLLDAVHLPLDVVRER